MDPRRAMIERNAHPARGARFYRDGAEVMFEFVIDPTNMLGPRPAHEGDKRNHPQAWAEFQRADTLRSLDHGGAELRDPMEFDHGQPRIKRAYRRKSQIEGV